MAGTGDHHGRRTAGLVMLAWGQRAPRDTEPFPLESGHALETAGWQTSPMPSPTIDIRVEDLSSPATLALIARHLSDMFDTSPAESVHALDVERLRHPDVIVWSASVDGEVAGIGALSRLDAGRGEVKSMRVDDRFRGCGVGRALLAHIISHARTVGFSSLWLETGTTADFVPAHRLYESTGFVRCGPFADYTDDPFSVFMTRTL